MRSKTPDSRSGLGSQYLRAIAILLVLASALLAIPSWAASETAVEREVWTVSDLRTSFAFRHDLLEGFGMAVQDVEATGAPLEHFKTSVSAGRDVVYAGVLSPSLQLEVEGHVPQRFIGTVLHRGGFRLVGSVGNISLAPFSLRSGAEPRTLEILSADGEVVFFADHMHFSLEREQGRLRSFNLDIRLAPALTDRLGAPALTGVYVGTLALEANFPARDPSPGGGCVPDWNGDVDVQLTSIGRVDSVMENSGLVGIAPSAELKNVGTADVPWWQKFSGPFPPYDNDQHPYLTWSFYRMTDARIEQLAVSDIKHAFLTLNFNCSPPDEGCDSHILGLGCEDIYGSSTNDSRSHLSLRDEIESRAALWDSSGSHFDPDDDGTQEHPPQDPDGTFDHRLIVAESDLTTAGSEYFMQAFYIIRDDIDIFNSMAYRQVTPSDNGGFGWSFPTAGGTINGSILDEWIDPDSPPANSSNEVAVDGNGHVQLAARATPVANGIRYEYVLLNHDFDPQIDAFHVPLNGEFAFDVSFRDIDDDPANDWQTTIEDGNLVWRLPGGAGSSPAHTGGVALDWGLMYNFAFTVFGGTTVSGQAAFEPFDGTGANRIQTIAPAGDSGLIFADGFESGNTSLWSGAVP